MVVQWDKIELLSFDIFDTLLFRAVAKPADLFSIVWDRAREQQLNKIDMSSAEYQQFRIEMERRARNKAVNREVRLTDIMDEMPDFIVTDKERLARLEVEAEAEYCYANTEICQLVKEAASRHVRTILVSDMYLTSDQLRQILSANHIDPDDFDSIWISSEHGCNKQSGELFAKVFERYPDVEKSRALHIGDNENSDYKQAAACGMQALHYDVIPDKMYSIFDYERIRHNVPLPQLLSLRKAAAGKRGRENRTAYEIGACVVGPFLTLYISWVMERMQALGIERIYPLMREGYLLGELLKREADDGGRTLTVKPVYISRKVTYIPSVRQINREEVENMIGARNLTVREAILLMGLKTVDFAGFEPFFDVKLKEAHTITYEKSTLKEAFITRLLEPGTVVTMEENIGRQRELLNAYLVQEIGDFHNAATIDIGFWGRIQMWMEQSLHLGGMETDLTHFLAIGIVGDKLYQGIHFEGYCSSMSENGDLVTTIHRTTDVLEKLISVSEGSTVGYQRTENNEIAPVKAEPVRNAMLPDVFAGIFAFQEMWFEFRKKKPQLARQCVENRREALMILHRLIDMPRREEAQLFTEIEGDTNFGTDYRENIITADNIRLMEEKGIGFIDKCNVSYTYKDSNIVWPKGLITLKDEFFYVRRALKEKSQNEIMKSMQELVERISEDGVKEAALYGAGENGRQFYFICMLYGIRVSCFIDRKQSLWGTRKEGVPVMGLREAMEKGTDTYIITSLFSISEIKAYIEESCRKAGRESCIYYV